MNKNHSDSDSSTPNPKTPTQTQHSFSLWDHLKFEINPELDYLQQQSHSTSLKSERISNFLNIPLSLERFIGFGFLICLDAFLSVFTILPIKFFYALFKFISTLTHRFKYATRSGSLKLYSLLCFQPHQKIKYQPKRLSVSSKIDLIQGLLIISVCVFLHHVTDASRMYHSVRGQETIKLYVIFNVLEVADRLCCSFGQDILDSLFSPSTLGRRVDGTQPHMKPIFLFTLAFIFTVAHALVLFYQLVSLNVAINSFDDSLMTLLISNQFVEIKGSVFKKFEKENLFQMGCADIVERFQLFLMLTIITIRNLIEVSGSSTSTGAGGGYQSSYMHQYLPRSFNLTPSLSLIEKTFSPVFVVMSSEVLVDWLKHAFITKFNHIRPPVYGRYIDVLCKDLVGVDQIDKLDQSGRTDQLIKPFVDRSPAVSRRLGFSVFPMFCLTVRVAFQAIDMLSDTSEEDFPRLLKKKTKIPYPDGPLSQSRFSFLESIQQQLIPIYWKVFNQSPWGMNDLDRIDTAFNPSDSTTALPPPSSSSFEFTTPLPEESSTFSRFQINGFIMLSVVIVMMFLILSKLYLGIRIRSYAITRVERMHERIPEDELNGRGRHPIGVSKVELERDQVDRQLIEKAEFDMPLRDQPPLPRSDLDDKKPCLSQLDGPCSPVADLPDPSLAQTPDRVSHADSPYQSSHISLPPCQPGTTPTKKKALSMDELGRFDMVRSRIW